MSERCLDYSTTAFCHILTINLYLLLDAVSQIYLPVAEKITTINTLAINRSANVKPSAKIHVYRKRKEKGMIFVKVLFMYWPGGRQEMISFTHLKGVSKYKTHDLVI
jgi:hypothetical protein